MGSSSSSEAAASVPIDPEADEATAKNCANIHQAAENGNVGAVRYFLRVDPESLERKDEDDEDRFSWTPLHLAAENGHVELVALLLRSGAFVEVKDYFRLTPLLIAAVRGCVEVVALLLRSGASVNVKDGSGWTPLHLAATMDHIEVVALLLRSGAFVDVKDGSGRTPLHLAAEGGCVEVVALLLRSGAFVDVKDGSGQTALHWTALHGHVAVVHLLLSAGATVDVATNMGRTALQYAAQSGHAAVVEQMISAGATVDAASNKGRTALHYAAQSGHAALVKQMISAGAMVDAATDEGQTALHLATENGHAAVVEQMISTGATVDAANNKRETALHLAAQSGHAAVVELLMSGGATVDAATKDGRTVLHYAAQSGHAAVVELLISAGAAVDVATNMGKTPYDMAERNGRRQVMGLLRPVFVALLSGRNCRCNSEGSRTVLELKEETEKKLGVKIKHIIGQNHEPLDEGKTLAAADVVPGNTLTAVIVAENKEGSAETEEAEPLDEAQGLKDPKSFIGFLKSADIRMVRLEFLLELHQDGLAMPRRQEAETMCTKSGATALVTLEDYEKLLVNDNTGHVSIRAGPRHQVVTVHFRSLSHMWESMQHPDPWRYQLAEVAQLYQNLQDVVWVFVDFMSLHQYKRNDSQESCFRKALERMHMLYSHEVVQVDILEDLTPEDRKVDGTLYVYDPADDGMKWVQITSLKLNPTPHALRGWCQAEKEWARLRMMLCNAMGIPTPPEIFRQRMRKMNFTHRDDAEQVFQLQAKVFQEKISGTTHLHLEQLSPEDLEALHEALPYYQKLQFVVVNGISLRGRDAVALVQSGAHDVQMESCSLEDEGAVLIADALMKDTTDRLRVLSLTGNSIGEAGRSALDKVMEQRQNLKIFM